MLADFGVDVRDWATQDVGLFGNEEIFELSRLLPQLNPLLVNPKLRGIIERPRILDLLVRSTEYGQVLPNTWVGESHLIDWFWETQVLRGGEFAVSNGLQELARRQADENELDTGFRELSASNVEAGQIIATGLLKERNERFAFEHDSLADWSRLPATCDPRDI